MEQKYWWGKITFEPRHDKTNKVTVRSAKTKISLGIRPVWSESSLSAWRKLGPLATHSVQAKTLIRLGRCPGWSESSLGAQSLCWFCSVSAHFQLSQVMRKPVFRDVSINSNRPAQLQKPEVLKFCWKQHLWALYYSKGANQAVRYPDWSGPLLFACPGPYRDFWKKGCKFKEFYKGDAYLKKILILRPKLAM